MNAGSIEGFLRLQKFIWFSVVMLSVIIFGYLLAENAIFAGMAFGGTAWLLLLPYHAPISIMVAVATFSSALILPFFPGRPFMWEFAALLGWTGIVINFSLRRYREGLWDSLREHKWLLAGVVGYCIILMVIMAYRGVGLRILGSSQMGGRFYFQQLSCAIFPLLFVMLRLDEKIIRQLFIAMCLFTSTWLVSDFVFANAPELFTLLYFFEIPGDALNFQLQRMGLGIVRYQSLAFFSTGLLWFLLVKNPLHSYLTGKGLYLIPLSLAVIGVGLLSGHRYTVGIIAMVLLFSAFTQKLFDMKNSIIASVVALITFLIAYGYAEQLPLAAQRTISIFPGIQVHRDARQDGLGTLETRRILREEGMKMIPQYFWIGRGFGQSGQGEHSLQWDPSSVTAHINQGRFYNGFIGLMVNTGIFGTFFMLLFLAMGTILALKVMFMLRRHGVEDEFSRVCCLVASLWLANAVAFIVFHGDSEYAMKTFSLQSGLLMVCHYMLRSRQQQPRGVE